MVWVVVSLHLQPHRGKTAPQSYFAKKPNPTQPQTSAGCGVPHGGTTGMLGTSSDPQESPLATLGLVFWQKASPCQQE